MFYNINEDKIEDFTGKGLSDLKSGIIRTPLCPIQTFMDDPLRILRSFRFSARYNYSIEDEVFKATKSEEIKKSFIKKISKERIGKEFDANFKNIFDTKNPFLFFRHIYDSGYWEVILQNDLKEKIAMGYAMFQKLTDNYDQLKDLYIETADALKEIKSYEVIYLSHFAVLTIEFNDPSITDKKKQPIYDFIKNKVKRPNVCVDFTTRFQSSLVQLYQINKDFSVTSLALWQREAGYMWRLVATVFSIINDDKNAINVEKLITEHGLETFHKEKCLLNGKEVADYFNVSKEDIRKKLDEVIVWQAINRGATKKDLLKSFNLI